MKPGDLSSLADLPDRLERFGDRPAAVFRGRYRSRTLTYRQLAGAALGTASRLAGLGVRPGERVLIRGADSPEWIASFLGCLRLGAVPVPLDASTGAALAERVVGWAGCAAAILPIQDPWEPGLPRLPLEARPVKGSPPPHPRPSRSAFGRSSMRILGERASFAPMMRGRRGRVSTTMRT